MIIVDLEWLKGKDRKRHPVLRLTMVPNDTPLKNAHREVCLRAIGGLIDVDSIVECPGCPPPGGDAAGGSGS